MRENHEIVLSEQEIQSICDDFGKKLTEELKDEEKTPLFLGVMKSFPAPGHQGGKGGACERPEGLILPAGSGRPRRSSLHSPVP